MPGSAEVVGIKMYDPQLHESVTGAFRQDEARWEPMVNWLSLLAALGSSVWGFDSHDVKKKLDRVEHAVEAIRDFLRK